jgi:uncharacterized protein (DUF1778 family)
MATTLKEEILTVRIPKDLKEKLGEAARMDQRTLSNLVVVILTKGLEDRLKKATEAA